MLTRTKLGLAAAVLAFTFLALPTDAYAKSKKPTAGQLRFIAHLLGIGVVQPKNDDDQKSFNNDDDDENNDDKDKDKGPPFDPPGPPFDPPGPPPCSPPHASPCIPKEKGNNGVGNGVDPQPPGNPPINDGPGTSPGDPGNKGGANK